MSMIVKRLSEKAMLPTKATEGSAGFDLYSAISMDIPPGKSGLIPTDLQIQLPKGCYGRVAPRSGLALKKSIMVGAGVIDEDYRGNIMVLLFNMGQENFKVEEKDKIAQLICQKIEYPILIELKENETLSETQRNTRGFGSSDV